MTGIMTSVITRSGIKYKENVMSSLLEIMDKKSCGNGMPMNSLLFI